MKQRLKQPKQSSTRCHRMESSLSLTAPCPPPPPPPLPLDKKLKGLLKDLSTLQTDHQSKNPPENNSTATKNEIRQHALRVQESIFGVDMDERHQVEELWRRLRRFSGSDDCFSSAVYVYKPIKSIIQSGPTCGLVSLDMACSIVCRNRLSISQLMQESIKLAISKQGEIFSGKHFVRLGCTLCIHCIIP